MAHSITSEITLRDIMAMSPEARKTLYRVSGVEGDKPKHIDKVTIDNNTFTDYSAFSYIMEKSFIKSPVRSSSGVINNLDSNAWFLTPHLKIDFSLMSIDSYRTLMKLIRSKNEFIVTCYDVVNDMDVTHKMYFATEQMPKLVAIARAMNDSTWVELLGVQDYTVELIGTNADFEEHTITYMLNKPADATWSGSISSVKTVASHITHKVGTTISDGSKNQDVSKITFGDTYKFKYWCENSAGTGFKYIDGNEYLFTTNTLLCAIWEKGG